MSKNKLFSILSVIVFLVALVFLLPKRLNLNIFNRTPAVKKWEVFEYEKVRFKYPAEWKRTKTKVTNRAVSQIIESPEGDYRLVFTLSENYNPKTKKPYKNYEELSGLDPTPKEVMLGNLKAVQVLPISGQENEIAVIAFSTDKIDLYTLQLVKNITGNKPKKEIEEAQQLFWEIADSFEEVVK